MYVNEFLIRSLFKAWNLKTGLTQTLNALEESQWMTAKEIEDLQWTRFVSTLKQAYTHSPYYRRVMQKRGLSPSSFNSFEDLERLPVLTRKDLQEHVEEMVCTNIPRASRVRAATGGSTGQPTPFYQDADFINSYRAAAVRCSRWVGWDVGKSWARIWGANSDVSAYDDFVQRLGLRLTNRMIIPAWELNEESLPTFAESLQRFEPCMVEGYTTPLHVFARYLLSHSITGIRPTGIVSSAETLFAHQRKDMEAAFQSKVFDRYGTREVGAIAHECPQGGMHLQAEHLRLEFARDGRLVDPGEPGQILVTTLTNYAMPLIRYDIGDVAAAMPQACPCGRGLPLMKHLEGRVQDLIVLPGGHYLPGEFFPHLLKDFDVREFQVRQTKIDELVLLLVKGHTLTEADIARLKNCVVNQVGQGMRLSVQIVDRIDRTQTGKWRYTISQVDSSNLWATKSK